jgi:hypothetical protein
MTSEQYDRVTRRCRELFLLKSQDYGPAWVILRMPSVTDQIYIKAERIRSIQVKRENRVGDSLEGEFMAIVNYCVIALILLEMQPQSLEERQAALADPGQLAARYDRSLAHAREVMERKNHDYGEAWRSLRISSMTDLILMKIYRLKQIEDNQGQVAASEGPAASYVDMLNYAAFCLIRISEGADAMN